MLFGFLCASIAGLFAQAWQVVVVSFAAGMCLGIVGGFLLSEAGNWLERKDLHKDD